MRFVCNQMVRRSLQAFSVLLVLSLNSLPTLANTTTGSLIDFSEIRRFAERALAAYQTPAQTRSQFPDTVHIGELDSVKVRYFVEHAGNGDQIISIRGTANLSNALQDISFTMSQDPTLGIWLHDGFSEAAFAVLDAVRPHISKEKPVVVTGHSLGAAISALLMVYLHQEEYTLKPSVNFGQPKVTNQAGADSLHYLPLTRIADKHDPVPMVPPITFVDVLHGAYAHFGQELILLDNQYYSYLSEHQAERLSVGSFWNNLGDQHLSDHSMDRYLQSISNKLSSAVPVPYRQREKYANH